MKTATCTSGAINYCARKSAQNQVLNNPDSSERSHQEQHPPSNQSMNYKRLANRKFQENEQKIVLVLCEEIRKRSMSIKVREVCQRTKITAPTFYLHYRSVDTMRTSYENKVFGEVKQSIPNQARSGLIFTIILRQIVKNQFYFLAAHASRDYYLLSKIITKYRKNLVGRRLGDRPFFAYTNKLISVISCWLEFDQLTPASAKKCLQELLKVRV